MTPESGQGISSSSTADAATAAARAGQRIEESSEPTAGFSAQHLRPKFIFAAVIVLTGLIAGSGGTLLALLLHLLQYIAYGYDLGHVRPPEDFLGGVTSATPLRRLAALSICGAVAGVGWWAVYRFGATLVSIGKAVGKAVPGPTMPFASTIAHVLLQIVTVALGSPLGREVAPRELAAMLATRLAAYAKITPEEVQIVIACGAGVGLAAVYNVPVGGAALALEVLLGTLAPKPVISAVAASVISTAVAWIDLGHVVQYRVPPLEISISLVVGACILGPICGAAAAGFRWLRQRVTREKPDGWKRIPWSILTFGFVGLLAALFPQLPGNGRGASQLGLAGNLTLVLAGSLLLLKVVAVAASLRSGAAGGILTPSFTIGALLATVLAYGWNAFFVYVPHAAFAVIGAAAFLASSMAMPLTAVVLTIEFTRVGHEMWVPIILAVAGSAATARLCALLPTPKFLAAAPLKLTVTTKEKSS